MKKILVFYDSADLVLARKVALEIKAAGFISWLADDDSKTDWLTEVEELVRSKICVGAVVIWSERSKSNPLTRDEAKEVTKARKPLLNLLLNGVIEAPLGLRDGPRHPLEYKLEDEIHGRVAPKIRTLFEDTKLQERVLILNDKKLYAPSMVLSVSSFETQIELNSALSLLNLVMPPAVLISAYDLSRPKQDTNDPKKQPAITDIATIEKLRESGSLVFLDSGNYESTRYQDQEWKEEKKLLQEVEGKVKVDLAFTHDSFPEEILPDRVSSQCRVDEISAEYERDQSLMSCAVAPIAHAPRFADRFGCEYLPEICCGVVRAVDPPLIAVTERELGDGIMERVRSVASIRKALTEQGSTTLLHVLGTGNPITMAFLAMAGADFFDGLEWCRTAIDGHRWRLYHFQQWDIFAGQHGLIEAPEIAQLVNNQNGEVPWITKVALHNLAFFIQASRTIRTHHSDGEYEQLFTYKELGNEYQLAKRLIEECK